MEVQDGFILGIYNYCDRWCEACAFTSRCRSFAMQAEHEAAHDPHLRVVAQAPPIPEEVPPPPPQWLQDIIEEANQALKTMAQKELDDLLPFVAESHQPIEARARGYSFRAAELIKSKGIADVHDPADARAVIQWFLIYISAKVYRALTGLTSAEEDDDGPHDYDGSAKAALLAIDRSHAAWLDLVERGALTMTEAMEVIGDLVWLGEKLEDVFPNARAFVRPGFDEPEEVAKLNAAGH